MTNYSVSNTCPCCGTEKELSIEIEDGANMKKISRQMKKCVIECDKCGFVNKPENSFTKLMNKLFGGNQNE